jgi:hypothetical protein
MLQSIKDYHSNEIPHFRYIVLDSLESIWGMAVTRTIVKTEDGTAYSEQIGMFFTDNEEKKRITFYYDPDSLYELIHGYMEKTLNTPGVKPEGLDDETWGVRRRLAKLMRSTVDGLLLLGGDMIIQVVTGRKDYPKKPKGVDRVEWYMELFARLGVSHLMQHDTLLYGKVIEDEAEQVTIQISGLLTRPVTDPAPTTPTDV